MDIKKKTWRDYEVFKCPLMDNIYEDANKSYFNNFYS